jgi:hypothetical protein
MAVTNSGSLRMYAWGGVNASKMPFTSTIIYISQKYPIYREVDEGRSGEL